MKTTSKELSIALKEAGAKQESEYRWMKGANGEWYLTRMHKDANFSKCSSFDCHELLEGLPAVLSNNGYRLSVVKWPGDFMPLIRFTAGYVSNEGRLVIGDPSPSGPTPAEALGKLYLWCLENGHCEKEGV